MQSVGIKTLKNRLSEYVRAAAAGETVLVTDRGQVVAELVSPRVRSDASPDEQRLGELMRQGLLAPAKTVEEMSRIVFNDRINAGLCVLFMAVVISILIYGIRASLAARAASRPTATEVPYEPMPAPVR